MEERLRIFLFFTFVVSKTYGMRVSIIIQNQEIIPVVDEDITLACIFTPPSKNDLLSWKDANNVLASSICQGKRCRNLYVSDMSKYSLRTDSSSGNLTIRDLTVDDSGRYLCSVYSPTDRVSNEVDLNVMLSGISILPIYPIILGKQQIFTKIHNSLLIYQSQNAKCMYMYLKIIQINFRFKMGVTAQKENFLYMISQV